MPIWWAVDVYLTRKDVLNIYKNQNRQVPPSRLEKTPRYMVYLTNKRELSFTQAFHNALNEIFFLLKEPLVLNRAFSLHTVLVYTKQTQNKDICKKKNQKNKQVTSEVLKFGNILVQVQSLWVWESSPLLNFFSCNYLLHSYFHFFPIYCILENKTSNDKVTLFR